MFVVFVLTWLDTLLILLVFALTWLVTFVILVVFWLTTLLILAILIKIDSKGPVFYRQERVTTNGKIFRIFLLRI